MKFRLSEEQMNDIFNSLDETGGRLIKDRELKYWIEFYVNQEVNDQKITIDCKLISWVNITEAITNRLKYLQKEMELLKDGERGTE